MEKMRGSCREYYWASAENRARIIARNKQWRADMPPEQRQAYLAKHAERNRAYRAAAKAAKTKTEAEAEAEADPTKA